MIHVDSAAARKAASIKTPDTLIIATAFAANLVLVSRDSDMNFVAGEYTKTKTETSPIYP